MKLRVLLLLTGTLTLSACSDSYDSQILGTLERDRLELIAESNEPIVEISVREGDAVAVRALSLVDGREPLLVVGVLTMMLGLTAAGAGLVGLAPLPGATAGRPHPPARTVLSGASPLAVEDHVGSEPDPHSGCFLASPSGAAASAPIDGDPREYLAKMTAMRLRRREPSVTAIRTDR